MDNKPSSRYEPSPDPDINMSDSDDGDEYTDAVSDTTMEVSAIQVSAPVTGSCVEVRSNFPSDAGTPVSNSKCENSDKCDNAVFVDAVDIPNNTSSIEMKSIFDKKFGLGWKR